MGKKIKKGEKGEVTQFITRSKAIRKLQLKLQDFRYLSHDPLLTKFREIKTYLKKYKKAIVRNDPTRAKMLEENKPEYTLNHLIKERYPTFSDALKDLEDPLCLLNLYATFPSHKDFGIPRDKIISCMKLSKEFNLFIIKSQTLRKVFVSIKGVYFQAEVEGETVTWITPFTFPQKLPVEVDYKIMGTFLEFYEDLLDSLKVNKNEVNEEFENRYEISDKFNDNQEVLQIKNKNNNQLKNLFKNMVFWINREIPKDICEFVILAFGGTVYTEDNKTGIKYEDEIITHVITDREPNQIKFYKNREYVQPQWVFDSVNNEIILPIKEYAPGKILPPHLSPFVDNKKEQYIPKRQQEINKIKNIVDEEKSITSEEEEEIIDENNENIDEYDYVKEKQKLQKIKQKEEFENKDLRKTMMTKKNRRILSRINFGKNMKREKAINLKKKSKLLKNKKNE